VDVSDIVNRHLFHHNASCNGDSDQHIKKSAKTQKVMFMVSAHFLSVSVLLNITFTCILPALVPQQMIT